MELRGTAHAKYSLKYHVILTVKYRHKLLSPIGGMGILVKEKINEIAIRDGFQLESIEVDQDHVHFLIETKPRISPSQLIMKIKQETTHALWEKFEKELRKEFWKTRLFWSPSYFITTVGVVNESVINNYIENQGKNKKPTRLYPRPSAPALMARR